MTLNKVFFLARSTRCLNMHGHLHYHVGDRFGGHVSPRHENTGSDYGSNCKCKKSQVCKNNPWLAQRKALFSYWTARQTKSHCLSGGWLGFHPSFKNFLAKKIPENPVSFTVKWRISHLNHNFQEKEKSCHIQTIPSLVHIFSNQIPTLHLPCKPGFSVLQTSHSGVCCECFWNQKAISWVCFHLVRNGGRSNAIRFWCELKKLSLVLRNILKTFQMHFNKAGIS